MILILWIQKALNDYYELFSNDLFELFSEQAELWPRRTQTV